MRALGRSAVAMVVGVTLGAAGAPVLAGPDSKKQDPAAADVVDIAPYRADLVVLTDDDGVIYVARPKAAGRDSGPVFVGDGKKFYEQYIVSSGINGAAGTWSYGLWAPRVPGYDEAQLYLNGDKKYFISCGNEKSTELRPVSKKEADRVLASGEFRRRLFARKTHLLARDDDGTYYFVDIDDDPRELTKTSANERRFQHGHRVFVGKKGAMKQLPMTNVVADSDGEIYQTKRGELRIVTANDRTGFWVRGRKKTTLKLLDLADNRYLIFRELGIYGFIGTACEDL